MVGSQPRNAAGLPRVRDKQIHFRRTVILRILNNMLIVIQSKMVKGKLAKLTDGMGLTGANHVIIGLILLKHEPHGLDIVTRKAPVVARLPNYQGAGPG